MPSTNLPETVSSPQLAELASVSLMTVNRWIREGRLTPIKKPNPMLRRNGPYRFRREEVERFLEPLYGRAS
jgi:excisionase family DNA binding protein